MVRDHANADELRSARTLSGGETFLASLSLALALADATAELSSEGAPTIESIFLDEGFGSLDPATLDVVAAAIEELGSTGRMVAVVTHIRELADRMPVRFEVTKAGSSVVRRADRDLMRFSVESWAPEYGVVDRGRGPRGRVRARRRHRRAALADWAPIVPGAGRAPGADHVRRRRAPRRRPGVDPRRRPRPRRRVRLGGRRHRRVRPARRPGHRVASRTGADRPGRVRRRRGVTTRHGAYELVPTVDADAARGEPGDPRPHDVAGAAPGDRRRRAIWSCSTARCAGAATRAASATSRPSTSSTCPTRSLPVLGRLGDGERTPLVLIGDRGPWSRWSWYLRLPGPRSHPLSGVVRCELPGTGSAPRRRRPRRHRVGVPAPLRQPAAQGRPGAPEPDPDRRPRAPAPPPPRRPRAARALAQGGGGHRFCPLTPARSGRSGRTERCWPPSCSPTIAAHGPIRQGERRRSGAATDAVPARRVQHDHTTSCATSSVRHSTTPSATGPSG